MALLRRLHITPVPTPIDASWLNAIAAHFGVTKRATLTGSDDRDHVPRRRRIYRYLRYRNRRVGQANHPLTRIRSGRSIKLERHWAITVVWGYLARSSMVRTMLPADFRLFVEVSG